MTSSASSLADKAHEIRAALRAIGITRPTRSEGGAK